jgi:hypothetical protein
MEGLPDPPSTPVSTPASIPAPTPTPLPPPPAAAPVARAALQPGQLNEATTLQLGPRAIFVFVCVNFERLGDGPEIRRLADDLIAQVKAVDPRIQAVAFYTAPPPA